MPAIKKIIRPIVSVALCLAAGGIGSIFTTPNITGWYAGLVRPSFAPPSWIFGPVWTTLFILMGIALSLIWAKAKESRTAKILTIVFLVHLAFNTLWSIIFFGWQRPDLAFLEIIILWGMILTLTVGFFRLDRRAGWLMLPYLLWVSFASVLNFAFWQLNQ